MPGVQARQLRGHDAPRHQRGFRRRLQHQERDPAATSGSGFWQVPRVSGEVPRPLRQRTGRRQDGTSPRTLRRAALRLAMATSSPRHTGSTKSFPSGGRRQHRTCDRTTRSGWREMPRRMTRPRRRSWLGTPRPPAAFPGAGLPMTLRSGSHPWAWLTSWLAGYRPPAIRRIIGEGYANPPAYAHLTTFSSTSMLRRVPGRPGRVRS